MIKRIIISALLLIASAASALAYDFMVDGLCYNKNSDGTSVTVTSEIDLEPSYSNRRVVSPNSSESNYSNLSGAISIPASVTYDGVTYSVTSIGGWAFSGCTGLTSVTIPNSVTSIGEEAFSWCSSLKSVTISNSVTSIGGWAFKRCPALESMKVVSGNPKYDSRDNCNAIIVTATNTLIFGCQNTTIPNSVTSIGTDAFFGCSGLTSVKIPNSVTSIGISAFEECTGLTSVTIGNSVTYINARAFCDCTSLTRIDAYPDPTKVTTGGQRIFGNVPKDGTLHVLPQYLSAYQTNYPWMDFTDIQADLYTGDVDGDGIVDLTDLNIVIDAILGN